MVASYRNLPEHDAPTHPPCQVPRPVDSPFSGVFPADPNLAQRPGAVIHRGSGSILQVFRIVSRDRTTKHPLANHPDRESKSLPETCRCQLEGVTPRIEAGCP